MLNIGFDLDPNIKVCTKCIYDERVSSISFDENGICNYCHQTDALSKQYATGQIEGNLNFKQIIEKIKWDGKKKKYDCIIGVSGGTDSSYMLHKAVTEWGIRPLAVHYDNTWNTSIATQNISKVLEKLKVDLYTHVVDNKEADDIFASFFRASVAEIDASTDLALAEVMYRAAWKYNVKYILEGHSFLTEGITPVGRNFFDGKYIKSIHSKYGKIKMTSYPLMDFKRFIFWTAIARIKKIRPFWYINYSKEDARKLLEQQYNWKYYGGHHLENRMTAFYHSIYLPQKFNTDLRNNTLSALVRNGKMSRLDAWNEYKKSSYVEEDLVLYFQKRLNLSPNEYISIMETPSKSWYEFPTYKKYFEILRPLFKLLADANLVPRSFYIKYCFPIEFKNK